MPSLADALSGARLGVAVGFPWALVRGGWLPAVLFVYAAVSDYVDGPIARRHGTTSARGAVLDNVADIAFVVGAAVTGAALGLGTWLAPIAIAASVTGYVAASRRLARQSGAPTLARSRVGHLAGVVNYVLAGAYALHRFTPSLAPAPAVAAVGWATAAINLAAIASRLVR